MGVALVRAKYTPKKVRIEGNSGRHPNAPVGAFARPSSLDATRWRRRGFRCVQASFLAYADGRTSAHAMVQRPEIRHSQFTFSRTYRAGSGRCVCVGKWCELTS